jgi:hypothetical protein
MPPASLAVLRCSYLCQDHILRFSDASLGVHLWHWIEESSKKTNLAVWVRLVEGLAPTAVEVREMEQQGDGGAEGPTHGCMQCKARQFYTVEELRNRNTLWRCAVCSHVANLIPGQYTADIVESGSDA